MIALKIKRQIRRFPKTVLKYGLVVILLVVVLFPFYWMAVTSLRPDRETYAGVRLWPKAPTMQHYQTLFAKTDFPIWFRNSITAASVTTVFSVIVSVFAAYGFVRLKFPGRHAFFRVVLVAYLFPPAVLFIPLSILVSNLKLNNSTYSLILTYPTFAIPFCTWMLISYFQNIPVQLEEAALLDGCSRTQSLFKIFIPLSAPGLIASAIFAFTLSWTELLYSLVMNTSPRSQTLTVGITGFVYSDVYAWGKLMSSALIMCTPVIILYIAAQKYVVGGLTAGAVKG